MSYDSTFTPQVQTFTLTNGGTSQILLAQDNGRQSLFIQPLTESTLVQFGGTAGTQATGTLTVDALPAVDETIAINGVTFTFKASSGSATQITIGADEAETAENMVTILNASANASINIATYTSDAEVVTVTYDAGGTDGNAYTLADSSAAAVLRSAATLAGGSNTVGGITLAQYQPLSWNAQDYPQIKNAVYLLSATNSAQTSYLVSEGA